MQHETPSGLKLSDIGYRRIRSLIRFMEKQKLERRNAFNMCSWFNHDGEHQLLKPGEEVKIKHLQDCGTSACAFGFACARPAFRKEGLAMWHTRGSDDLRFKVGSRVFEDGIVAARRFFDLDQHTALSLFSGTSNVSTPKQWAKRARIVLGMKK